MAQWGNVFNFFVFITNMIGFWLVMSQKIPTIEFTSSLDRLEID